MDKDISFFESEKILDLLREIESNPNLTQRYFANKYGISLGKTNFLIKALLNKGIIKVQNFKNSKNKIGYLYALTPAGIKMRLHLTQKFFLRKSEEYQRLKCEIDNIKKDISANIVK